MNGDNVVIIVSKGDVVKVYSDNVNVIATVVDLDNKINGNDYIEAYSWPDTQFDEEAIRDFIGDKVRDFMN
jgi:hypothetical protein